MSKINRKDIYPLQDPVKPEDYWIGSRGSDGKTKNFQASDVGQAISDQLGLSNIFTGLISVDEINVDDLDVEVINAYYKIAGTEYYVPISNLTIETASVGFYRIDNIIGYTSGTLAIEQGVEDENNPAQLPVAPTTVLVGTIYVYGGEAAVTIPPITDIKLKSTEAQFKVYWTGTIAQTSWNQFNTYRWSAPSGNAILQSMITPGATAPFKYDGRMFYLVNDTAGAGTLTVKHLTGAGSVLFFLPNATDLIIPKGFIATFKYLALTSSLGRLELVSFSNINAVIGYSVSVADYGYPLTKKGQGKTAGVPNVGPSLQINDICFGRAQITDPDLGVQEAIIDSAIYNGGDPALESSYTFYSYQYLP